MGSHKGNGSNGNRGKPYGLMLLLAFGAALLGVMVIHKLRERRIFNLLVQDKDNHLISLQLLLKKERDYDKEMKKKTDEMKAKIYSLRTQKMELESRVLEMQSTIDSLKEEQKTLESALEEKQNEIKMLRKARRYTEYRNPQVVALLTETLKQKEAVIENLKHQLEHPDKIWSVSADDSSNPNINFNTTANDGHKYNIDINKNKEHEQFHESAHYSNGLNSPGSIQSDDTSSRVENGGKNRMSITDWRKEHKEQILGNAVEQLRNGGETGNENSEERGALDVGDLNNIMNKNDAVVNSVGNALKTGDANEVKSVNAGKHKITRDGQLKLENSQQKGALSWK